MGIPSLASFNEVDLVMMCQILHYSLWQSWVMRDRESAAGMTKYIY